MATTWFFVVVGVVVVVTVLGSVVVVLLSTADVAVAILTAVFRSEKDGQTSCAFSILSMICTCFDLVYTMRSPNNLTTFEGNSDDRIHWDTLRYPGTSPSSVPYDRRDHNFDTKNRPI